MKQYGILIGFILVFLVVLGVVFFVMVQTRETAPEPSEEPTPVLPGAGDSQTEEPQATITIQAQDGSSAVVYDFLHATTTVADPANTGTYYLAGESGYCDMETAVCAQGAPSDNFIIVYYESEQSFAIALTQEPLGAARRAAEQFLSAKLGLSVRELCALNYYLTVDSYTNAQFAGDNLGFSVCPGAIALP